MKDILTKEEYILYEKGDNRLSVRDYQTVIQRIEDKMKEVEEETTVKHEIHTIHKGDIEITLRVQIVEGTSLDKYRAGVDIQRIGWANNKEEVNGYIKKILLVSLRNEE